MDMTTRIEQIKKERYCDTTAIGRMEGWRSRSDDEAQGSRHYS